MTTMFVGLVLTTCKEKMMDDRMKDEILGMLIISGIGALIGAMLAFAI